MNTPPNPSRQTSADPSFPMEDERIDQSESTLAESPTNPTAPTEHGLTEHGPAKSAAKQSAESPPDVWRTLNTDVQRIKGIGPARGAALAKMGLGRAVDLLFHFPKSYEDLRSVKGFGELEDGLTATVRGRVDEVDGRAMGVNRTVVSVLVKQGPDYARAVWFNQGFMRDKFQVGQEVLLTGRVKRQGLVWEMPHPQVKWIEADAENPVGRLEPVYRLSDGFSQRHMRQSVQAAIELAAGVLEEVFPAEFLAAHNLCPILRAVEQIHFPTDDRTLAEARRRFVYQDLFIMQMALAMKRRAQSAEAASPELPATAKIDTRIRRLLPFELTPGQRRVIDEIAQDMARPTPMNRLLQGDVGSGKTAAAIYAMLTAVAHGWQAVLMAPTEILARQHAETLDKLLAASQVRRQVFLGGMTASVRKKALEDVAAGEVDLMVGTQALLQDDVKFHKLGLVVIDEQHKFGVRQRASLRSAGASPHYLVMTATPIPRTVAMTLFGDLDVSNLRDSPPGRPGVRTYLADQEAREKWWDFYRRKLREGRQGYVVAPMVETSERVDAASAEAMYESLANGPLEEFRLGLVHGRMSPDDKQRAMDEFRSGKIQVLVATSVVEVGVDVPNATLMTIEDGDRFGLSALHQLRGRVSRGQHPGFCCVFSTTSSYDSRERLEAFVNTQDGFELAEVDFQLRGPGHLLGTRQHGAAPLFFADLSRDADILQEARRDALSLVDSDPQLSRPEHHRLRQRVLARYGQVFDLGDVG